MSRRAALPQFSIAGKTFLLGEYAILAGVPAIITAVGPRFMAEPGNSSFHPESPAGLLHAAKMGAPIEFHDPYGGAGGFGASTAQFALSLAASGPSRKALSVLEVYDLYRKLTHTPVFPPSGADLVAQWEGGTVFFDPTERKVEKLQSPLFKNIMVFGASLQKGRKVATHNHLPELAQRGLFKPGSAWLTSLQVWVERGYHALKSGNARVFGECLTGYAQDLAREELEIAPTRSDREAFMAVPGVLGIKGTGALQADALVILVDPAQPQAREKVKELAHSRKLVLVADGLKSEAGVIC